MVDLAAPVLYHTDKYPHWHPYPVTSDRRDPLRTRPHNGGDRRRNVDAPNQDFYPRITRRLDSIGVVPQIEMDPRLWSVHYSQIEAFIDEQLSNGNTVYMFDDRPQHQEACGAAGATA